MKSLKQLLGKIEAAEQHVGDIAAQKKAEHMDRETALGALGYCCLSEAEKGALKASAARGEPVGETEIAAEKRFEDLSARFAACATTSAARDIWEQFHPGYRGFEPVMIRVFKALGIGDGR